MVYWGGEMESITIYVILLLLILFVLHSINKKLAILADERTKQASDEDNIRTEMRDELVEIRRHLEEIKHTTDIIENYKLPSPSERKILDQMQIDQEIDDMLFNKNA